MNELLDFIITIRFADLLDIVIVAGIFYAILAILRETRSSASLNGLIGIILGGFFLYAVARLMHLTATMQLFEKFWIVIVLMFLVVFQNEFRKALTDVGQLWLFRRLFARSGEYLEEVLKAVRAFSRQKIGALICIERRTPLDTYADTGTIVDAQVSSELLRTIFMTYSPLHDGAVILRGDRVVAAGCILPLSSNPSLSKELGTRHRAGIGLSEETDAAVIIVSEETGTISLAVRGKLERPHTIESLREALQELLNAKRESEEEEETSEQPASSQGR